MHDIALLVADSGNSATQRVFASIADNWRNGGKGLVEQAAIRDHGRRNHRINDEEIRRP